MARPRKIEIYIAADEGWRWRLRGGNGEIIAASSESFADRSACLRNMRLTRDALVTAEIVDLEREQG